MKIRFLVATTLLLSGVAWTWNHRIEIRGRNPASVSVLR